MKTGLRDLKKEIYDYHHKYYQYIFEWPWYSYRRLKALFYMNAAAVFTWIFLRIKIRPNEVTGLYLFSGMLGGILIAIPYRACILSGILIFFVRPILDWSDGILARLKNETSVSGKLLDPFASDIGWIFLWAGTGIYLGNSTSSIFYYLAPIVIAVMALSYDLNYLLKEEYLKTRAGESTSQNDAGATRDNAVGAVARLAMIKQWVDKIFEFNARTVDLMLLLIALEMISAIKILWVFYIAFLSWQIIVFLAKIILIMRGDWVESELAKLASGGKERKKEE